MAPGLPPLSGSASSLVILIGSEVGKQQDHHSGFALAWGQGETSDSFLSEVLVPQRRRRTSTSRQGA